MSKLYFFFSTMNAGKTTNLLQYNYNYNEKKITTLLFIPQIANKHGEVISRIGLKQKAIIIEENSNIFKIVKNYKKKINKILIDEVQFLKKKHIFQLISIVDILNISVLTFGLRTDFKTKLFEASKYLLALSDKIIEIKALCKCGQKAILNAKINKNNKKLLNGKQIDINKKRYISLCRYHYYHFKN